MATHEDIEKVRQAIMRYRELLDIMQHYVRDGERAYIRLMQQYGPDNAAEMKEKDVQWQVAEAIVDDPTELNRAVLQSQFNAREMERAFEELYGILVTEDDAQQE